MTNKRDFLLFPHDINSIMSIFIDTIFANTFYSLKYLVKYDGILGYLSEMVQVLNGVTQ